MKPYVIMSPDFSLTSGGIRVMWGLFGHLLAKGQEVYMNRRPEGDIIAIYPEIVQGNPAQANTVIRYILNKPGVMASNGVPGPTQFDKKDKIIVFSKLFDVWGVDNKDLMFLPIIDTHTFKDQHKPRTKTAYFVGKGYNSEYHPKDAIEITREMSRNQQWLADVLNECQEIYQYDPVSAMSEIARLCGCKVRMINNVYSKDDYKNYEPGMNGISWGLEENVPLDTQGFTLHYNSLKADFSRKLDNFIEETQHPKLKVMHHPV